MISERFRPQPNRTTAIWPHGGAEASLDSLPRAIRIQRIRFVGYASLVNNHLMHRIALKVLEWALRGIDRKLMEIRPTQPAQLRIQIRKEPSLQKWVFRKVDSWHNVARTERNLFSFGKEIIHRSIEHQLTDHLERNLLLGNDFRGVQYIEFKIVSKLLIENLQPQLPLRKLSRTDRVPQIPPVEIGIGAINLQRLIP